MAVDGDLMKTKASDEWKLAEAFNLSLKLSSFKERGRERAIAYLERERRETSRVIEGRRQQIGEEVS